MKNYIQDGETVDMTATADVTSGQGVKKGVLFGVAVASVKSGETMSLKTTGCVSLPKVNAQAWAEGAAVYWDNGNGRCTTASAGNLLIGCALAAAANPSAEGTVRLNGSAPAAVS